MFDKAWKVITGAAALVLLLAGVWYLATREPRRQMHPLLHELAQESVRAFAQAVPKDRDLDQLLLLVAGRGHRDEEKQFVDMLEDELQRAPKYRLKTWSWVEEQASSTWLGELAKKLGMIPGQPPHSLEKAAEVVKALDTANISIDGILFVDVEEFSEGEEGFGARISLEGDVWSRKQKKVVAEVPQVTRAIESRWDHRYLSYRLSNASLLARFLAFFVIAAGAPWALIGVVRRVVKKRNNPLNLTLLVGLTLLDLAVAFVLLTALTVGPGSITLLILVAGAMGYYNYDACDYIERKLL